MRPQTVMPVVSSDSPPLDQTNITRPSARTVVTGGLSVVNNESDCWISTSCTTVKPAVPGVTLGLKIEKTGSLPSPCQLERT